MLYVIFFSFNSKDIFIKFSYTIASFFKKNYLFLKKYRVSINSRENDIIINCIWMMNSYRVLLFTYIDIIILYNLLWEFILRPTKEYLF
jgi:hypothetical protein